MRMNRSSQAQSSSISRTDGKRSLWQRFVALISSAAAGADSSGVTRDAQVRNPGFAPRGEKIVKSTSARPRARSGRSSQKPEAVDVTTSRLYVGNLAFRATTADLSELFKTVGTVKSVEIISHSRTQRSKGFAFVQMDSVDEAKFAVERLHDHEFLGRKLVVSGAKQTAFKDAHKE